MYVCVYMNLRTSKWWNTDQWSCSVSTE